MKKKVLNLAIFILLIFTLMGCGELDTLSSYPSSYQVEKKIVEYGRVQITYADGTIVTRSASGTVTEYPKGEVVEDPNYIQINNVQSTGQPEAPPTTFWADDHSKYLLEIIQKQVGQDSVDKYIAYEETQNLDVFKEIKKRSQTINYLVSP